MNCPQCQTPIPNAADVCPFCATLRRLSDDTPPPQKCRMAETAEVLAGLGLVTCGLTAIPGLVLGLVAYKRIVYSEGRLNGRGHAVSAIILSVVAFAIGYWVVSIVGEVDTRRASARTTTDMYMVTAALAAYRNDWGTYPSVLPQLTTPVPYLNALPGYYIEPDGGGLGPLTYDPFNARTEDGRTIYDGCVILNPGPDKKVDVDPARDLPPDRYFTYDEAVARLLPKTYDVSNGTYSAGDILRVSVGAGTKAP